ncbi:Protein giant [Formica fusca]
MEQRNDHQTWSLSCCSKQDSVSEGESEFLNYPVLDLSCKNPVTPTTIKGTNTTACLSQSLPAHTDKQYQHSSLSDTKKQSPFASTIMLSSSSELDFPRETTEKCEPFFYNGGNAIKNSIPLFAPPSGVTMEVPFLRPLVPLHLNSGAINNSVATSTTASTSPPYTERETSSLQTNDKTTETTALSFLNESSTQAEMSTPSLTAVKKTARPFKVYSKNPFPILKRQINPVFQYLSRDYLEYREKMLDYKKMQENAPNPKMRRTSKSPALPTSTADEKDPAYYEKRKKNNEAAKRSRDLRRKKEDELAIWATFLEEENVKLKSELAGLYCLLRQMGMDISQLRALINVNL